MEQHCGSEGVVYLRFSSELIKDLCFGWSIYEGLSIYWIHLSLAYFVVFRWDRLGDIVVLPVSSFKDPVWDSFGDELWPIVTKSLGAQRLARQVWFVIRTSSELPWLLVAFSLFIGFKPSCTCQVSVAHLHCFIELLFLGMSFSIGFLGMSCCTVDGIHMGNLDVGVHCT